MNEEREKVRCQSCELIQWNDRETCRRCGVRLREPIVKIVERVVEKVVVRQDLECVRNLEQARQLIAEASDRLMHSGTETMMPFVFAAGDGAVGFPTMAEVERAMILAAYQHANRKPLEAARLLGIGKTTLYRKLREMGDVA